jgi:small subunit ribosomal protein S27Ae
MGEKPKAAKTKLYKVEGTTIKRLRQTCPRCGPGVFLAEHGNRLACGKCGYTEFKK